MKHILLIFMFLSTVALYAQQPRRVAATPHPFTVEQPNGDTLTVRLHGSEYGHYHTTIDGYKIKKNRRGYFCYVKTKASGKERITCRRASNAEDRTPRTLRFLSNQPKQN